MPRQFPQVPGVSTCRGVKQSPALARLSLVPQKREFFGLYNRAAANIVAVSELLEELLERFPDGADDLVRKVKEFEHEGDRLTHELVDLLNRTFVTPFDRDDMYRLAGALDDICDHIDEAAGGGGSLRRRRRPPPGRGPGRSRPAAAGEPPPPRRPAPG